MSPVPESVESAELSAVLVGAVTSVLGTALIGFPKQVGGLAGVRDDRGLRVLGAVDLIVAAGLSPVGRAGPGWRLAPPAIRLPPSIS